MRYFKMGCNWPNEIFSYRVRPYNVKVNAICLGSVEGERLERVIEAEVKSKGMTRDKIYQA